jgi:SAM-dependent methyltransferase
MVSNETFQRDAFSGDEGDRFFSRNKEGLSAASPLKTWVTERIARHLPLDKRARVLEVGCASGGNLAALSSCASADCSGLDPSNDAVQSGKLAYPYLDLRAGSADHLPFGDGSMDVVWFGFCLYLVDRALLQRVVAEADRVLKDGGFIAIHDFDPDVPCVRPYRHRPGVNSYKMDYSALFLCNPAYVLAEKTAFSDGGAAWTSDPQERIALWICKKNLLLGYQAL